MRKKGVSLLELLVAMFILSMILAAATSFYIHSLNESSKQRIKASMESNVKEVFRMIEDDVRHAGFGFKKTSPSGGIAIFAVDNCSSSNDTFCVKGTSRFFIADGWQIIRDFTNDNCPDGQINDADYETIPQDGFYAKVTSYTKNDKYITEDKLNIDSRSRKLARNGALCGASTSDNIDNDITDRKAIIVSGCTDDSGNTNSEGRRVSAVNEDTNTITFVSEEKPLKYDNCSEGIVLPANVWYVKKSSDGSYWLYRNEYKVMKNVTGFQVVGCYIDSSGTEHCNNVKDNLTLFKVKVRCFYLWKNQKIYINYKTKIEAFH